MKKILMLLVLLVLMGCSGGSKVPESEKIFNDTMTTLQSGNLDKISKIPNSTFNTSALESAPFYLEHFKKIKYKIIETKEEKDTAAIKFSMEAPDLLEYSPEVLQDIMSLAFSGTSQEVITKAMNKGFADILKKSDLKYTNDEITLNMKKENDAWVIDTNSPDYKKFSSILVGGLDRMSQDGSANAAALETKHFKKGERGVIVATAQTVTEVNVLEKIKYHDIKEGNEIIVIKIIKENISDHIVTGMHSDSYQIETKDGLLIKPMIAAGLGDYSYDDLPIGNKVEQTLVYEVPKGQTANLVMINDGNKDVVYDLGL